MVDVPDDGGQFGNGVFAAESAEGMTSGSADGHPEALGSDGVVRDAVHFAVKTVEFLDTGPVIPVDAADAFQVAQPFFAGVGHEEDAVFAGLQVPRNDIFQAEQQRGQVGRVVADAGTEEAFAVIPQGQGGRIGKDHVRVGREDDKGLAAVDVHGQDDVQGLVDIGVPGTPAFQQGLAEPGPFFLVQRRGRNPGQGHEQVLREGCVGLDEVQGILVQQ